MRFEGTDTSLMVVVEESFSSKGARKAPSFMQALLPTRTHASVPVDMAHHIYRNIQTPTHAILFGGNELATQVRRFEVLIHHGLDWQTHPTPTALINMLSATRHVEDLQLHIEHEFFSHQLVIDPNFGLLSFPNLSRLTVMLIPNFDHTPLLRFLQKHPSLTQLSISVPSRNFFLHRPYLSRFTETITLPQLRSYSGALEILNLISPTVTALQSIVIDFGVSRVEDVEPDLRATHRPVLLVRRMSDGSDTG
ncbi:hypothetical protein D9758_016215 [Tetrapyrgos nigripes]|uniref:Uncharacterized protein n=1 Tax=Tetrapyrgos nigripes TaxID=182062 RepID=A0A8H5CL46_9AGAR|nr:hypothetical protein D9758_016215 [Tetrapyrgos nigripes]